jgi:hypothetical protein
VSAQQRPPIRQLGAVTAKSAENLTNVPSVRALSNGSILVNDMASRRVLMFDPQLSKFSVLADSTSATGNAYGGRMGALIAYRGDSTIFADPVSVSMLIIDPAGKIARVVAIPRAAAERGRQFDPELTDLFLDLIERLRKEHEDLDEYLGRAGKSSPFLQARNRIRQMLAEEREQEKKATVEGNQTRH